MKPFAILTALAALPALAASSPARAESTIAAGAVVQRHVGMRAALEADALGVAVEHYRGADATRTRLQLALRVPIRVFGGFQIEPEMGLIPLDHMPAGDAVTYTLSATGAIRLRARIVGGVSLILEPARAEARFLRVTFVPIDGVQVPMWDRALGFEVASSAALAYAW